MKKKFLFFTLALFGVIAVFAQNRTPEGLLYEIVDGKTVTITGYKGSAATLVIPEYIQGLPVTVVNRLAYLYRVSTGLLPITDGGDIMVAGDSLTSVTIPSSVTYIGDGAFANCGNLTSIIVDSRNSSYASIDGVLFDKNIRTIKVYPIGKTDSTFNIPSSVTGIGNHSFSSCYRLVGINIPSSVTSIGDYAFYECGSLTNIIIPSSVTSIGNEVFRACRSLTSITIPSSVVSIGEGAFYDCYSLTVTLSRRTQVGQYAFPETTRIIYRD